MLSKDSVRIDKWLWAVRLFRSRSLAVQACQAGHIKVGGLRAKPAREVRVGDIIIAQTGRIRRHVRVAGLLERRIGAKQLGAYMEDLTPDEERAKALRADQEPIVRYPRGLGRPTKKQRRQLEGLL